MGLSCPDLGSLGVACQAAVVSRLVRVQVPLLVSISPVLTLISVSILGGNVRVRGCLSLPVILAFSVPSVLMVNVRLICVPSMV